MRVVLAAAIAASTLFCTAACSTTTVEPKTATCPSETFDLENRAEPLGSSDSLIDAFDAAAAHQIETTTMLDMARSAGWSEGWDQVIYIDALTTDEALKRKVSPDLHLACFTNRPPKSPDPDQPSPHTTVFMAAGKPVQAVWWRDREPSLRFGKRDFLLPATVIRYNPTTGTMTAE
ncbi:hypothetical protein IU449_13525 [Nocardia higoensis]|uniref:Lipoprotein n=1 Tax=Nocardia higoensis TaxID=228599 RepID=A0ABS0DAQ4_9NOCA|nr:hypothetical protein [Nocardia higoensis]MBF6355551.1 hypothetical protein [Nocardia higoensis]